MEVLSIEERFKKWMEENPGWVKTSYGTWTNEIENEQFRKYIEENEYLQREENEDTLK